MALRGLRGMEKISAQQIENAIGQIGNESWFVYNTGGSYSAQRGSLRFASLQTIRERETPVPFNELLRRAATIDKEEGRGYDPRRVKEGLLFHQRSKPTVYLLLCKTDKGFVAARDIPDADGFGPLAAGDIVLEKRPRRTSESALRE